eukprot:m51a1_g3412 hypothetical protein (328) ;mRNA; f:573507-574836
MRCPVREYPMLKWLLRFVAYQPSSFRRYAIVGVVLQAIALTGLVVNGLVGNMKHPLCRTIVPAAGSTASEVVLKPEWLGEVKSSAYALTSQANVVFLTVLSWFALLRGVFRRIKSSLVMFHGLVAMASVSSILSIVGIVSNISWLRGYYRALDVLMAYADVECVGKYDDSTWWWSLYLCVLLFWMQISFNSVILDLTQSMKGPTLLDFINVVYARVQNLLRYGPRGLRYTVGMPRQERSGRTSAVDPALLVRRQGETLFHELCWSSEPVAIPMSLSQFERLLRSLLGATNEEIIRGIVRNDAEPISTDADIGRLVAGDKIEVTFRRR